MQQSAQSYAYFSEAAIFSHEEGEMMADEANRPPAEVCRVFARAAAAALTALILSRHGRVDPNSHNIMAMVAELDAIGFTGIDEIHFQHARVATRVLILTQLIAGADYLAVDLFDTSDYVVSRKASRFFCELMCTDLLRMKFMDVMLRCYEVRQRPMVNAEFWRRRRLWQTRLVKAAKQAAADAREAARDAALDAADLADGTGRTGG